MALPVLAILAAVTAVAGGVSARGSYVSGKIQEQELERQAEQERIAAEGRELQRREELNRALAARQMALATSGLAGEGTPQSIALSTAEKIGMGEGLESLTTNLKTAQMRRQAANARKTGKLQAASTLLKTGAQAVMLLGSGGGENPGGGDGGGTT
jgi:hypothetical protein